MLHHSISDVRILARVYLETHPSRSDRQLSLDITGSSGRTQYSEKLIARLLAGKSCRAETLELASNWFRENWPRNVPWPLDVRHIVAQERAQAAE